MSAAHYSSTNVIKGRSQSDKPIVLPRYRSEIIRNQSSSGDMTAAVGRNGFSGQDRLNTSLPTDPGAERMNGSKCDCCPYGFHIDLGFVQYAEDVASGHYLKHLRQLRKAKKKMRKSMEIALAQQQKIDEAKQRGSYYENSAPSENHQRRFSPDKMSRRTAPIPEVSSPIVDPNDRSGALSPNAESIFSDSLENVMSDFDETFSQHSLGRKNPSAAAPSARSKDYSSDFEVGTEQYRRKFRNNSEQGYQSDYGYAIPAQLARKRERENGNSSLPLSSSLLLNSTSRGSISSMRRPDRLPVESHGSLSPTRRLRQMETDAYAAPSDFNLSDSVSSLSSISSNPPPSAGPGNYRGISGQIAANIESLSKVLRPLEKRYDGDRLSGGVARPGNSSEWTERGYGGYGSRRLGSESSGLRRTDSGEEDPAILRAIREQMAVSLNHMKDLEEQVKNIPILSSRISSLKSEKERLAMDLLAAKKTKPTVPPRPQRRSEDLSPLSPPETPDSRPSTRGPLAGGQQPPKTFVTYSSTTALGRVMTDVHKAPQPPPRSTSVDRMREKALSPAPPPPIPPKPERRQEGTRLVRTQSGNLRSLDEFHSLRRNGKPKMRDEDYASDSELSLGENRLMDKFASLRRSRRLLQQSSGTTARSYVAYHDSTMSDTEEFYSGGSPNKNYSISNSAVRRPRALSSVSAALAETGTPQRYADDVISPSSPIGYKELLQKWRQDFLTTTRSEEAAPPSEPTATKTVAPALETSRRRSSVSKSTETEPEVETEKKSIGVGANLKPEVEKSTTKVEMIRTGSCADCDRRRERGRISIGIGTGPLPAPRPPKHCQDCKTLKEKVDSLSQKPMQFNVSSAAGDQVLETPTKSTNTEQKQVYSIATGVNLEPPKPETMSFSTNTEEKALSSIASGTEPPQICNRHVNTEPSLCRHSGTNVGFSEFGNEVGIGVNRRDFQSTIGIGTDISGPKALEAAMRSSKSPGNLKHSASNTDLDLDAVLQQAEMVSNRPALTAQGTNTEIIRTVEKGTAAERSAFLSSVATATEAKSFSSTKCGTESPKTADTELNTDPVDIRSPSERRSVTTNTGRLANRSVYVSTDVVPMINRSTDAVPRVRETGTNPQRVTPTGGLISRTTSSNSVSNFLDSRQGSFDYGERVGPSLLTKRDSIEKKDAGAQVELPPDEEDVMIWVREYQEQFPQEVVEQATPGGPWPPVAKISVGSGESSVEEETAPSLCQACSSKLTEDTDPYSFSRHVGVGSCRVTDRVCVSCDSRKSSRSESTEGGETGGGEEGDGGERGFLEEADEMEAPGLSFEHSPAYHERQVKKDVPQAPPRPKKQRSESIETGELELHSSGSSSFTPSSSSQSSSMEEQHTKQDTDEEEEEASDSESPGYKKPVEAVKSEGSGTPEMGRKVDLKKPRATRAFELSKAAAAKKMLTSEQSKSPQTFRRGTAASKSMRVEGRKGDHLAYITDKRKPGVPAKPVAQQPSTSQAATAKTSSGLKGKVAIKQQRAGGIQTNPKIPPRTGAKVLKPVQNPAKRKSREITPGVDEQAEAEDRLTPLPSEMMSMSRSAYERSRQRGQQGGGGGGGYENPVALEGEEEEEVGERPEGRPLVGSVVENLPGREDGDSSSSESSSDEDSIEDEGSYDTNGNITPRCEVEQGNMASFEMSQPLKDACDILNRHLTKAEAIPFDKLTWAQQYLQHEWLKTAARKNTNPHHVEAFLDAAEAYSKQLIHKIVNISDQNENTALHYGVSHGNFDVVSLLLDSKVANLNRANKAGYTPVMLAALCPIMDETIRMVIQRLFHMGDVNIKASQHGQTALMLAVSHGKYETSRLLIEAGAGVNIQDEDGSTALMCASEHGHKDIVKMLLAHTEIDASLADFDGSTALSIAVDNGHRDIGVLIYAHLNYARGLSVGESSATLPV